jgi:hypothetical protein
MRNTDADANANIIFKNLHKAVFVYLCTAARLDRRTAGESRRSEELVGEERYCIVLHRNSNLVHTLRVGLNPLPRGEKKHIGDVFQNKITSREIGLPNVDVIINY